MRQLLFVYCEHRRDLRVEARAKSERFAHEMPKDRNCSAQTEQPGGLFTGARRQRRKSRRLNQKSEICLCGSPIFCCAAGLERADLWSKAKRALAKGLPQKSRSEFCGKRRNKPPSQAARDAAADFTALFRRRDQKVVGSNPVASTIQKGVDLRQLLFVYCEHRRDLRVEARAKSERFAHEMPKDRNCSAQTEQPGGCSPGRAAKGENPVASTKNRRSAFADLRFFAVQPSLNERTFGPKPNALSRKGSRKKKQSLGPHQKGS